MLIRMANSYLFTLIVPALMLISETPKTERRLRTSQKR